MSQNQSFIGPAQSIQALVPISVRRQSQRQNNIPNWFEQHVLDLIISPATRSFVNLIWITEAFDHFNEGHFELPEHLCQVQPALIREWNEGTKRPENVSRLRRQTVASEELTRLGLLPRGRTIVCRSREKVGKKPSKSYHPLRKYDAIYTIGEVKYGQVDYYPELPCSFLLSFCDGDAMLGAFHLADLSSVLQATHLGERKDEVVARRC